MADFNSGAMDEAALIARFLQHEQDEQRLGPDFLREPVNEVYRVKRTEPLPKGDYFVELATQRKYMGPSAYLNDPSPNISTLRATVFFVPSGDDDTADSDTRRQSIGRIAAKAVMVGRMMNYSGELHLECDEESAELGEMAAAFYDEDGDPKMDEFLQGDLLYIEEIFLEPAFRGYGLGLLALDTLIAMLPSFTQNPIILRPAPLSESRMGGHASLAAQAKLENYYELYGFTRWTKGKRGNVFLGIWTGYHNPRIWDVCPHLFPGGI